MQGQCTGYDFHYDNFDEDFRHPMDPDPDAIYYPRGSGWFDLQPFQLVGKTLYVTGEFVMSSIGGMTFRDCTFLMGPGAQFTQATFPGASYDPFDQGPPQFNSGKLVFDNCTFEACSDFMWEGIHGTAAFETRIRGGVQIFKEASIELLSCTVKDAYIGFYEDKIKGSNVLSDNSFENCYVGILYGRTDDLSVYSMNTVIGGPLKKPTGDMLIVDNERVSLAGVYLSYAAGLQRRRKVYSQYVISNCTYGVLLDTSFPSIHISNRYEGNYDNDGTFVGISEAEIVDCEVGVFCSNPLDVSVSNTSVIACGVGVIADQVNEFELKSSSVIKDVDRPLDISVLKEVKLIDSRIENFAKSSILSYSGINSLLPVRSCLIDYMVFKADSMIEEDQGHLTVESSSTWRAGVELRLRRSSFLGATDYGVRLLGPTFGSIVANTFESCSNAVIASNLGVPPTFTVASNKITDVSTAYAGVLYRVLNTGSAGNFRSNTISNPSIPFETALRLASVSGISARLDLEMDNYVHGARGALVTGASRNNLIGNSDISLDANNPAKGVEFLKSVGDNHLCCNNIQSENAIDINGTNPNMQLIGNQVTGGSIRLSHSMIGPQVHNRNEFSDVGSLALLESSLVNDAAFDNRFTYDPNSTYSVGYLPVPQSISPLSIANRWFFSEFNPGAIQKTCAESPECDSAGGRRVGTGDDIIVSDLVKCSDGLFDLDGDGLCGGDDPDDTNACDPVESDADGDGICDGVDPDPFDACLPIATDLDGDGICDIEDPGPADPCNPIATDSDGDGYCDVADPDPHDDDIPGTTGDPVYEDDCSIDFYQPHPIRWELIEFAEDAISRFQSEEAYPIAQYEFDLWIARKCRDYPYFRGYSVVVSDYYQTMSQDVKVLSRFLHPTDPMVFATEMSDDIYSSRVIAKRIDLLSEYQQSADSASYLLINDHIAASRFALSAHIQALVDAEIMQLECVLLELGSITPTSTFSAMHKDILEAYYDVSPSNLDQLALMATLCSDTYGHLPHLADDVWRVKSGNLMIEAVQDCASQLQGYSAKQDAEQRLLVYPNPAYDLITLDLPDQEVTYSIHSLLGVEVQKGRGTGLQQVKVENLEAGWYTVSITTIDGVLSQIFKKI